MGGFGRPYLGPSPVFQSGTSKVKVYQGEDCDGAGEPGMYMPVVGAIGQPAENDIENGMNTNPTYESGPLSDLDIFSDLTNSNDPGIAQSPIDGIDPDMLVCEDMHRSVEVLRQIADVTCPDGSTYRATYASPTEGMLKIQDQVGRVMVLPGTCKAAQE